MNKKITLIFEIIIIALLMCGVISAQSSTKTTAVKPPIDAVISIDPVEFDFGAVPPNTQVAHRFPVKNEGTDTLVIYRIKPG